MLCFALILSASWFLLQYMAMQGHRRQPGGGRGRPVPDPVPAADHGGDAHLLAAPDAPARPGRPRRYLVLAVAFVVALNPLVNELRPPGRAVVPDLLRRSRSRWARSCPRSPGLWVAIGVFALLPAICEEVAFRGFILSGLEHRRRTRSAILLSALMFGFLHVLLSLFQQLFNATLLGIVLGLLAVRSRSLLPGILFHFLNNAFAIAQASWIGDARVGGRRVLDLSQSGRGSLSWGLDRR